MKYVLQTHSGKEFSISELQATYAADQKNKGLVLQFKNYPGEFIISSDVKSITKLKETQDSTPLALMAGDVFSRCEEVGFWHTIARINKERKEQSEQSTWLFSSFVEACRGLSGCTDAYELLAFITAEWDTMPLKLNVPNVHNPAYHKENKRLREQFLNTEEGMDYAHKWRMSY